MVNLLPKDARNRAVREYRLRLVAVAAFAAAGLFAALSALLMPSYFFAMLARAQSSAEENAVNASLSGTQIAGAAAQEKAAALLYAAVAAQLKYPRPSQGVDAALSIPHRGVSLERIEYMDTKTGATMRVSGIALTRGDLLAFKQSLSGVPGVRDLTLPLATLALSNNLPFSISFAYAAPQATSTRGSPK